MLAGLKSKASAVGAKAKSSKDDGVAKLLQWINELRPILRAAGYAISGVNLSIGLPPKAELELDNVAPVDMAALEALQNRTEPKPLTRSQRAVVKMLMKVESLERTIEEKQWRLRGISIETGIIPTVQLQLVPQDPSSAGDAAAAAVPGESLDDSAIGEPADE